MPRCDELINWIRDENVKVSDLSNRLRERTAVVPRSNLNVWITDAQTRFEHFRAHMIRHMALEEQEGYLPIVMERRPGLAPEVERLQHEHKELIYLMRGIHTVLHELTPEDRLQVRDCCRRIEDLLAYVEHHEALENNLLLSVCSEDIGTKD